MTQLDIILDEYHPSDGYTEEEVDEHIMGMRMTLHFSLTKGIEIFGDKVEKATTKNLKQIHDMGMYKPHDTGC